MELIQASVYPVPADGLEKFKDLALPFDVQVLKHDEDAAVGQICTHTREFRVFMAMRKPLPSGDVFYLITDINMVVPSVCLLLLLHVLASLCCCIWSPPLITAAIPLGGLLLLHVLNKSDAAKKQHTS
ncbi:hypothetical protein cyc_02434 [Cyclospora cayetanensis]|uniref:Uncharacterized protein n=1 Tax=Cyclospora cayetanensis TaxID=88456 RepID=A0A1D3CYZ6_9EIME|nr:hypothetical protein cyc_02434 [Cyclospora cayetanensis]